MATIAIVFRKDKMNKKGLSPIHFRITKNRKPVYISTGIMVPKENWDEKNQKVKPNHKNSGRINSFLATKQTELYNMVLENEASTKSLSSADLKERSFGKTPEKYFPFAERILENYKLEGKIGTYHKNLAVLNKLRNYCKNNNLTFFELTPAYLTNYEQYLRKFHKNKTNTVNKDMKFHRRVFNEAIRLDVIDYNSTPFRKYQLKIEKTQRDYLTEEELRWIEMYPANTGSRIELHRNMFIFAAYTGGLRISDMLKLRWKDFDGTHLHIVIKKTGVQVSIKVPNKGLEILKSLYSNNQNPESFIFPLLPKELDLADPFALDLSISRCTSYANKNLKIIANAVGIKKNLSFHISRHSFAVLALRKGISIDKVSKILAHSNIRETQIYAKVVNEELDKAMDVFNT